MKSQFQQLGRYLLVEKIASGGMADVYRAKLFGIEGFEKDVAIKKILPYWSGNREFIDMLVDEAKVLLHLTHANIVQVFELNKEDETYYIVMEYVDGVDLRSLIKQLKKKEREFSPPLICYIAQQVLNGLQFAHERKDRHSKPLGIVHRDISPQNILLSSEGEVKITDFGIARVVGKTTETTTGTLKGKFAYMSPEQALGQRVDHRTDIFALGILLYEMITGDRCFKGDNDLKTLESVKEARITFPKNTLERIPSQLIDIILGALKKNREERFQTATSLRNEIRSLENTMGYLVSPSDLKQLIFEIFPERFTRRREREEELTAKTRLHLETALEHETVSRRKTKVLVGEKTALLQEEEAQHTIVNYAKTFIVEKTRIVLEQLPKTVLDHISRLKNLKNIGKKPYWIGAAAVFVVTLGLILLISLSPEPVAKKGERVEKRAEEIREVSAKVAEPVKSVEAEPEADIKPFSALLSVSADPEGSTITIRYDGKEVKKQDKNQINLELTGEEKFSVIVSKKGYNTVRREITLSKDQPKHAEKVALKHLTFGRLVVRAKPWGRVYLANVVSGAETPFSKKNVPVGNYNLKVVFPPRGKAVTKAIRINENATVRCQAVFGSSSGINCR